MHTKNEDELIALGQELGSLLEKNDVLILTGELGAGKTTLTKGLAKGLGIHPSRSNLHPLRCDKHPSDTGVDVLHTLER